MVISNALDSICRGRECYLTELKDCAIVKGKTQFCSIANAREILDRIQIGKLEHNSLRVRLPAKEPKSIGTHLKMEFHSIILTSLQVEPIAPFFPKWLTNDFLVLIIIFALSSTYTGDIMQRIFLYKTFVKFKHQQKLGFHFIRKVKHLLFEEPTPVCLLLPNSNLEPQITFASMWCVDPGWAPHAHKSHSIIPLPQLDRGQKI